MYNSVAEAEAAKKQRQIELEEEAERYEAEQAKKRDAWYRQYDTAAPAHLSKRAKALWKKIVPIEVRCDERKALLTTALEALDRADEARQIIATDGMIKITERSGVAHAHPLLKIERDSRTQFAVLWKQLDLHMRDQQEPREFD